MNQLVQFYTRTTLSLRCTLYYKEISTDSYSRANFYCPHLDTRHLIFIDKVHFFLNRYYDFSVHNNSTVVSVYRNTEHYH
jgi:hypothetical protein